MPIQTLPQFNGCAPPESAEVASLWIELCESRRRVFARSVLRLVRAACMSSQPNVTELLRDIEDDACERIGDCVSPYDWMPDPADLAAMKAIRDQTHAILRLVDPKQTEG